MNKIIHLLFIVVLMSLSGCAPANKDIPNPDDINVFINNIVGTVTDTSTSYSISMATTDTLSNDTLVSLGLDDITQDEMLMSVYHLDTGTFPIELLPAGTAKGGVLFRKKNGSSYKNYLMTSGNIKVAVVDTFNKRTKGTIDVNNIGSFADHEYTIKADFNVKINP